MKNLQNAITRVLENDVHYKVVDIDLTEKSILIYFNHRTDEDTKNEEYENLFKALEKDGLKLTKRHFTNRFLYLTFNNEIEIAVYNY